MFLLLLMRDYGGIKVLVAACFLASSALRSVFTGDTYQIHIIPDKYGLYSMCSLEFICTWMQENHQFD